MVTLIFGAGDFGFRCLQSFELNARKQIGFIDNDKLLWNRKLYGQHLCYSPDDVNQLEYDRIIIANNTSEKVRFDLLKQLLLLGVPFEKVSFFPEYRIKEINYAWNMIDLLRRCAQVINDENIPGNIAECGVALGNSAKHLNRLFIDRKLYLFDTFQGFAQQDIEIEVSLGDKAFIDGQFNEVGRFANTSIDTVMDKMIFPENIYPVAGRVPDTFDGIKDNFCFVHLDMDLYKPMLEALFFFWNKMTKNGIILVHDYYHPDLPGVKRAVTDFEKQIGRKIPKIPNVEAYMSLVKDKN